MRFKEYDQVRLLADRDAPEEHPFTGLDTPRAVTSRDRGVIVMLYGGEPAAYEVEFFDEQDQTVDLLTVSEDEIEAW